VSCSPAWNELTGHDGNRMTSAGMHRIWIDRFGLFHEILLATFVSGPRNPAGAFQTVEDSFVAEAAAEACELSMMENRSVKIDLIA